MSDIRTAGLVIIGNEILSGRTRDANLQALASGCAEQGIRLVEVRVVRDIEDPIIDAVNALRASCDVVFTTGGIGPTHDDITAAAVAKALGRKLTRHPEADKILRAYYDDERINEARMKMADGPEGAGLIPNPLSHAPGFRVDNVFILPGVPSIVQAMLEDLLPELGSGKKVLSCTVSSYVREGDVADGLSRVQDAHDAVEIGSYPFYRSGKLGTSLVLRGDDRVALDAAEADVIALLKSLGHEPVVLDALDAG